MNNFEFNKINNYLLFAEGLFKAAYVLSSEEVQNLSNDFSKQKNSQESSDAYLICPLCGGQLVYDNEEFVCNNCGNKVGFKESQFSAKNFKVVEFNRYLKPELMAAIKKNKISAVVCQDSKTSNVIVCYDPRESKKMRSLETDIYNDCKNFQTNMKTLENINATVDGASIRTLRNLSDFQFHALCAKLPQYKVSFVGNIARRDGLHSIDFSSVDDKKVTQCVKDVAEFSCSQDGIEMFKSIQKDTQVLKNIEQNIKNGETTYIASSQFGKYYKVEPNQLTTLEERPDGRLVQAAIKNNPIVGNVFKESVWLGLSQNVIDMPNSAALNEKEFSNFLASSIEDRFSLLESKEAEIENELKTSLEDRGADEITKELRTELAAAHEERNSLDELE